MLIFFYAIVITRSQTFNNIMSHMHAATANLSILNPSYHWAGLIFNLKDTATKSNFSFVLKLREA